MKLKLGQNQEEEKYVTAELARLRAENEKIKADNALLYSRKRNKRRDTQEKPKQD